MLGAPLSCTGAVFQRGRRLNHLSQADLASIAKSSRSLKLRRRRVGAKQCRSKSAL
jgi:hypothetical protein